MHIHIIPYIRNGNKDILFRIKTNKKNAFCCSLIIHMYQNLTVFTFQMFSWHSWVGLCPFSLLYMILKPHPFSGAQFEAKWLIWRHQIGHLILSSWWQRREFSIIYRFAYIYIYIYIRIYLIYINGHIYIYTYMNIYAYICVCACLCVCVCEREFFI